MASQFRKSRERIDAAGGERNRKRAPVVAVTAANPQPPPDGEAKAEPPAAAKRIGIGLERGWHKRNFLTEVLLPSLLQKRDGTPNASPLFPQLAQGEIGITWIGHASFFVQMAGLNILIDPNWSLWLKGIKRLRTPGCCSTNCR